MKESKIKVLVEVNGGCVIDVVSTESVDLYIVDHDNIKASDDENIIDQTLMPFHPNIVDQEKFGECLTTVMKEYLTKGELK